LASGDDVSLQIACVICASKNAAVRKAMNTEKHPALLMVDTVSFLASIDYRHDEWGVDSRSAAPKKGLMLPPGLRFNAVSQKALSASESARLPHAFWSWEEMRGPNKIGYFPATPATNLLYGLREAISMLHEEGLEQVFQRHLRLGEATRRAVRGWGLELLCLNAAEYSPSCTAVMMPSGFEEAQFRNVVLEHYNLSLGAGLGKVAGRVFRIGHLGDLNDLMLCGALCGVEMGLGRVGIPHQPGGVAAAMGFLRG
jgi:alanine-glyoxylate transaminase/serine-glyoxylate transaminase/serine-pyruvate transaminase